MADAPTPEANPQPAAPAAVPPPAAAAAPATPAPVAPEDLKPPAPKDEKNKLCCGHLKRWYDYPKEIEKLIGKKAEIYRCEFCKTLYKPDLSSGPHSYTLRY
jgi:hypothetical protein